MSQIFISHSKEDKDLINFFSKVFSSTKVKAIWEEFKKIITLNSVTSKKIKDDIKQSNALFIILSQNVQALPHTRDWVDWESGVGSASNKDIWVFEPYRQLGSISVVTPHLNHYVLFETNNSWFKYIWQIIDSYNDSNILLATTVGELQRITTLEGLIGDPVRDKSINRPTGIEIKCSYCSLVYNIHFPIPDRSNQFNFRCPVCNKYLSLLLRL